MKQIKMFSAKSIGQLEDMVNEFLSDISQQNVVDIKITEVSGWYTATIIYLSEEQADKNAKPTVEYHKYQLEWLRDHDVTLEDIVAKSINNYAITVECNSTKEDIVGEVMEMIEETGFNGECYACFNEWKDNEGVENDL